MAFSCGTSSGSAKVTRRGDLDVSTGGEGFVVVDLVVSSSLPSAFGGGGGCCCCVSSLCPSAGGGGDGDCCCVDCDG